MNYKALGPKPSDLLASRGAQIAGIGVAALAALQAFGAIDPATVGDGSGWLSTALSTVLDRLGAGGTGALGALAIFANRLAARLKMRGEQLDDVLEYTRATADTLTTMRVEQAELARKGTLEQRPEVLESTQDGDQETARDVMISESRIDAHRQILDRIDSLDIGRRLGKLETALRLPRHDVHGLDGSEPTSIDELESKWVDLAEMLEEHGSRIDALDTYRHSSEATFRSDHKRLDQIDARLDSLDDRWVGGLKRTLDDHALGLATAATRLDALETSHDDLTEKTNARALATSDRLLAVENTPGVAADLPDPAG